MPEAEKTNEEVAIRDLCADIGELIVWAENIDHQLTQAVIYLCHLHESKLLHPVVSEIPTKQRMRLLRDFSKAISNEDWKRKLLEWIKRLDEVNENRNTVAHSRIAIVEEKFVFHSERATKLVGLANKGEGPKDASPVMQWRDTARAVFAEGEVVLRNLQALYAKGQERQGVPQVAAAAASDSATGDS